MSGNKHPFSFQSQSAAILIAAQIVIREFSVLLQQRFSPLSKLFPRQRSTAPICNCTALFQRFSKSQNL